jgi:hypothetical protein
MPSMPTIGVEVSYPLSVCLEEDGMPFCSPCREEPDKYRGLVDAPQHAAYFGG